MRLSCGCYVRYNVAMLWLLCLPPLKVFNLDLFITLEHYELHYKSKAVGTFFVNPD